MDTIIDTRNPELVKLVDEKIYTLKEGEIVEGKIIETKRASVYVDLGPFGTGIILSLIHI